jgi:hypothetical protein
VSGYAGMRGPMASSTCCIVTTFFVPVMRRFGAGQ